MTYFSYLVKMIGGAEHGPSNLSYRKMLRHLYNTVYTPIVPMDENRADYGVSLRKEALDMGDVVVYLEPSVSVLEVLIGLSRQFEMLFGDYYRMSAADVLWFFAENLKLTEFDDSNYDGDKIDEILEKFINKKPGGSIFGLRSLTKGRKKMELWEEMQVWANENDPE